MPTAATLSCKNLEAFSIKSMTKLSNEEIKGVQLTLTENFYLRLFKLNITLTDWSCSSNRAGTQYAQGLVLTPSTENEDVAV